MMVSLAASPPSTQSSLLSSLVASLILDLTCAWMLLATGSKATGQFCLMRYGNKTALRLILLNPHLACVYLRLVRRQKWFETAVKENKVWRPFAIDLILVIYVLWEVQLFQTREGRHANSNLAAAAA